MTLHDLIDELEQALHLKNLRDEFSGLIARFRHHAAETGQPAAQEPAGDAQPSAPVSQAQPAAATPAGHPGGLGVADVLASQSPEYRARQDGYVATEAASQPKPDDGDISDGWKARRLGPNDTVLKFTLRHPTGDPQITFELDPGSPATAIHAVALQGDNEVFRGDVTATGGVVQAMHPTALPRGVELALRVSADHEVSAKIALIG